LINLTYLNLSNNSLFGNIPSEITNLTNLTSLYLTYNCDIYSDDISVQQFIDDVTYGGSYQYILDTNRHNCHKVPVLVPVITYVLH